MRWILLAVLAAMLAGCSQATSVIATPTPTQTPIEAIRARGLTAMNPQRMEGGDYGFAPRLCSGTRFELEPLTVAGKPAKHYSFVFTCDTADDLQRLKAFYDAGGMHTYVKGSMLLAMSNLLSKPEADMYGNALK